MSSSVDSSNGFLPLEPLRHADPTAVGVWDMDGGGPIWRPLEPPAQGTRDQIVLVRLHGEPLAVLHLEQRAGDETPADLMSATWRAASDRIIEHVTSCRCLPAPEGIDELRAMLDSGAGTCPGSAPGRPHGEAAVILCTTGDDQNALARSLAALAQMTGGHFEIVVVDNRPARPETRSLVEGFASPVPVRYVAEPRPGLAIARNTGVAAASGAGYVAFTDDDVVVDPGWLSWLLAPLNQTGTQAATGLVMPLSLASAAEKRFEHYAGFGKGVLGATYDLAEHAAEDRFLYPYWGGMFGSGNSMAFRRESLLAVGGFDQALGAGTATAGGEDIAAFTDVILAGGQIGYEPRSLCWHEHRGDEDALRTQVRNYGIGLTAVLWRYMTRDLRFSTTLARSLPAIARLARSRSDDRELDRMPSDLARLELQGRLLGPWRYVVSSRGAARHPAGGRHPEADQAGAQTRT